MTRLAWCLLLAGLCAWLNPARAEVYDVGIVLAMDVSASITPERFELQRAGTAAAFRQPGVIRSLSAGPRGAIAVIVVQWSGAAMQQRMTGWHALRTLADAERLAQEIESMPRAFADFTSIANALLFCKPLLDEVAADRKVIDVSGDGANNNGTDMAGAREEVLGAGVVINGLPILGNEADVDKYYRENVIGGEGSFYVTAESFDDFARALKAKLEREIAGFPRVYAESHP